MITRLLAVLTILPALAFSGDSASKIEAGKDVSYALGYKLGIRISEETSVDIKATLRGIGDALSGTPSRLSEDEAGALLEAFQKSRAIEHKAAMERRGEENKGIGAKYLESNANRDGVIETNSGLQYEVIRKGEGAYPRGRDIVKVLYKGSLISGKVFDSTEDRGNEPVELPLDRVIPGWTEGLQLMNRGAKYKFHIPPHLAYGEKGAGQSVGPNEVLIFEVELVDFAER